VSVLNVLLLPSVITFLSLWGGLLLLKPLDKFTAFYETQRFVAVFTGSRISSLSSAD
jgi:hypothetical protein